MSTEKPKHLWKKRENQLDNDDNNNTEERKQSLHVVNIELNDKDGETRITGSADEISFSASGELSPFVKLNGTVSPDSGTSIQKPSWNNSFDYNTLAIQSVTAGEKGIQFPRFLPRFGDPDPGLVDAYYLEQQLAHAESLDDFLWNLERREKRAEVNLRRASDITSLTHNVKTFNHTVKGHQSNQLPNGTGNMSDGETHAHVSGALNPAYQADDDVVHIKTDDDSVEITRFGSPPATPLQTESNVDYDSAKIEISNQVAQARDNGIAGDRSTFIVKKTDDIKISMMNDENDARNRTMDDTVVLNIEGVNGRTNLPDSVKTNKLSDSSKSRNTLAQSLKAQEVPPETDVKDEDTKWLEWIEVKFKEIAGDDGQIDLDEFKKALGVRKSFFAERFFELFDQDKSGTIELGELMDGLRMLTKGTPAQKLQFLFDVFDADGSGTIERDELVAVLRACMEESSLSLTDENLEDLTDALFDAADEDDSGEISFDELKAELEKHPGVIENLTISAAQWLKPPTTKKGGKPRFRYFTKDYLKNNLRKVMFFIVYWLVNIALFIYGCYNYRESNGWIIVARGCGMCLNFNCMWVLVLMLRKCITFLRMTKLCHVLPFDQNILFHKMTALAIAGFSLVHTGAHIGNAVTIGTDALPTWAILFTERAGLGWVGGSAFLTGWILDIILIVMVICSMPFVRRGGHFQVFYLSHMLYVPFWILVIIHGSNFWKWFILPGVLFILEKISRSKLLKMVRYGDTYIEEVNLLASGVTHLMISKSVNFKYQPGDYIFIQIPAIAKHEWHPFTISSAPEMEGQLWLHVRSAGHWTNKLYKYFDELKVNTSNSSSMASSRRATQRFSKFKDNPKDLLQAASRRLTTNSAKSSRRKTQTKQKVRNKTVKVQCYIDGPYGTGTREVFDAEHAVLVGAGIGVTPMASILQSVWYKFNATRLNCPSCSHIWYPEDECDMNLKKVDFIWINRDQKSFEWFLTLLNQLELEQSSNHGVLENCIQMHMYMTAAQKMTDMKGIGLQIAMDLMFEKTEKDLITGLRTKTEPGRPDWNKVFKAIKAENKGKVKVFFCGAPALGKIIKEAAERFGFAFSKENF